MDVAKCGAATSIASSKVKTWATNLTDSLVAQEMIVFLILDTTCETDTVLHHT